VTLLFVTATVRTMVGHVKAQVVAAASKMDADSEAISLQDISHLKQLHVEADGIVAEVLATLELVRVARRTQLDLVAQSDLMDAAAANINAAERRLDRLDRTIGHLQNRYDASQQDKTNRRLGTLTVLSAIFMPLTLMAGLWGMNFAYMPELHLPWGYPGALALMVVVAGCLYWYFSSRGWLE
jgi:Mg2+ and Co2+ transporter CorA